MHVRRALYLQTLGDLPNEAVMMSTCSNPRCVKQSHIKIGTNEDRSIVLYNSNYEENRYGENNLAAKLTENDVMAIRALCADKTNRRQEIAQMYGVSQVQVNAIARRKYWAHVE